MNRHNHFGHSGGRDSEAAYVFRGEVPLFAEGSAPGRASVIRAGGYKTLRELITDAKFTVPDESVPMKPALLFGDNVPSGNSHLHWGPEYWYFTLGNRQCALPEIERQVSFLYLQSLAVPRPMRFDLTHREDSVKIGFLKRGGGFGQEGVYGINIMGLRPGLV